MNTKTAIVKVARLLITVSILTSAAALWSARPGKRVVAAPPGMATIGGCIYTGGGSVTYTVDALGEPVANWNTIYHDSTAAYDPGDPGAPIYDAQVMVQNQHSGGAFITYGTITATGSSPGNCWTADVPAPGDYIVMFSAPGHDLTSREFTVDAAGIVTNPTGSGAMQDAYLPPLLDLDGDSVYTDLPRANLLHYVFYDKKVNGNDDGALIDPGLNGVTINVYDEEGNLLATGLTGDVNGDGAVDALDTFTTIDGITYGGPAGEPINGYIYFQGLPPGEVVVESDPSTVTQALNPHFALYEPDAGREWYLTYTEEGGPTWDPKLWPGSPGTEDGFYLTWHGFIEKLGNDGGGNPAISGSISGVLMDADGNDPEEPFPTTLGGRVPPTNSGYVTGLDVEPNSRIPDGALALYTVGDFPELIATAESTQPTGQNDPNGGEFTFVNVPPGQYEIYAWDIPLNNVPAVGTAVTVNPLATSSVSILMPRFGARAQGYVMNNGVPVAGADVIAHYKGGITKKETTTDANGWFNFDFLPEIEVMGYVLVKLPDGSTIRGKIITEPFDQDGSGPIAPIYVTHNAMGRYVQWATYNYFVDIQVEDIPAGVGDINGVVYYDHFRRGAWVGDGVYDEHEERLFEGVTVNLYNAAGTLIATTLTGRFDAAATMAQGWDEPYTWPPNEIGGVFAGPAIGFYEFRDLAPGTYRVEVVPPTGYTDPYDKFFTSLNGSGTGIAGIPGTVGDEDILFFDGALFHMFFDGSAHSLPGNADIDALHVVDQDTFYVSFAGATTAQTTAVPAGVTSAAFAADDEDIALYNAGDWSLFFDGSAYGLGDNNGEDVDSVSILADGRMVFSTRGSANATTTNPNPLPTNPAGVWNGTNPRPQDEDLLVFDPATGYFDLYFDGSDVALNVTGDAEDVSGAAVTSNGDIYLTTNGTFLTSSGFTGGGNDVFVCRGAVTGSATSCASEASFFKGVTYGVDNTTAESLDALSLYGSGLAPDAVVIGGQSRRVNLGVNTTNVANGAIFGVPLAGEIEGGVFDDTTLDMNPLSLLFQEKAGIVGAPVGVYDHYNYLLGVGFMGNPLCYTGSTVCPPGEPLGQKPEMERRFAPGVHRYLGNDPAFPGYNPAFDPMELPYTFPQGGYKFEADWSLLPASIGGPPLADMCVVDLTGSAVGDPWGAQVIATVKDDANVPVVGARVIGNWSTAGTMECTTNGAGQCTIALTTVEPQSAPSVTFDVTSVDPVGQPWYAYNPAGPGCATQATIANPGGGGPPGGMRVTDLDGVGAFSEGTKWFATVTINVGDGAYPVATAIVFGTWSTGKAVSCTTNATGQCSVISETIENVAITSIDFTVTDVTDENPATPAYDAGLNSDSDGDSDGTTITVLRP